MSNRLGAVAAVLILAGCTPAPPPTPAPPSAASSSVVPSAVPACDSKEVADRTEPTARLRCDLHDARFPRLRFEYSDPGGGQGERDEVVVVRNGDRVIQTIRERIGSSYPETPFAPHWANDGSGQLVIVTNSGGSGGIAMAVWRALGPEGPFVRGGELFGFPSRMATTDEGFSAIYAHASVASGGYTIFRLAGDRVIRLLDLPVAVAVPNPAPAMEPDGTGPIITAGRTSCRAVSATPAEATELQAAGVTVASVGEHFCRQAWVGRTYS